MSKQESFDEVVERGAERINRFILAVYQNAMAAIFFLPLLPIISLMYFVGKKTVATKPKLAGIGTNEAGK